jgi:hypothetical protein
VLQTGFSLGSFLEPEDVPPKRWVTSNGLYGIVFQKTYLFERSLWLAGWLVGWLAGCWTKRLAHWVVYRLVSVIGGWDGWLIG